MAREKQFLINYHTSGENTAPLKDDVRLGEIVVRHADNKPELIIKKNNGEFATFIDSVAINAIKTTLEGLIDGVDDKVDTLSGAVINNYYVKNDVDSKINTAKNDVYASAKTYTDGKITESNSALTTSINAVDARVTALSGVVEANKTAVDTKFNDYYTSAQTNDAIATAKGEAIASASSYTDGQVSSAKTELSNSINGVDAKVTALTTTVNTFSGAVESKFGQYATSADTVSAIATAKDEAVQEAKDYTDEQVSSAVTILNGKIEDVAGDVADLSAATENALSEISTKITTAYVFKGSKDTFEELPQEGNVEGDVWNVVNAVGNPGEAGYTPAGTNYAWNGTEWDALGGTVDLSAYAKTEDVNKNIASVESKVNTLSSSVVTDYATSANTVSAINSAKESAIASASSYTDGQVSSAKTELSNSINGVDAKVTALTTTVNTFSGAVESKFGQYATSADTVSAIETAKGEAIASAKSYTDTQVSSAVTILNKEIEGLGGRIEDLEELSATTQSAIQEIAVSGIEGVEVETDGTKRTINFTEMVIDCGEF